MKKFYTMITQQPISSSYYGDEHGCLFQTCKHAVHMPLIVTLCNEIKPGESFKVIAMDSFQNPSSLKNLEILIQELEENFSGQYELCKVEAPLEASADGQISLFKKIYKTFETDDEIFFDITFGYKLIPMTIMIACNYAKKFVEGIRIRKFVYAVYDFSQKDNSEFVHSILDVTSLFYLNDFIDKLAMFETKDPTVLIDQLFAVQGEGK